MNQLKAFPTIGVCGLDCGMCPRYYTDGPSRCPGCGGPGFADKHPSCGFITCCVKRKGLEVCGQCADFPCAKFKSEEEYRAVSLSSSYPPYAVTLRNQRFIKAHGIEEFADTQRERIGLLEAMIAHFDDGRSKSFYCRAAALLDADELKSSMDQAQSAAGDAKARANALKTHLSAAAGRKGINLKAKK